MSESERDPRKRERPIVISAASAPPALASRVEAQTGPARGPLPEARLEITGSGEPSVSDLLRAQIRADRLEHDRAVERADPSRTGKKPGYERELWERGRAGPERHLER
jgi:hypothetical protein